MHPVAGGVRANGMNPSGRGTGARMSARGGGGNGAAMKNWRTSFLRGALLVAVFASGALALAEEVVWARMLAGVFGSTAAAQAAVVAAFMGGIALGSFWLGPKADRDPARALTLYGALEMGLAIAVLTMPMVLRPAFDSGGPKGILLSVYLAAGDPASLGAGGAFLLRVLLAGLALLLPTFLMGGTLPFAVRLWGGGRATDGAPALYAANTLGAAFGACMAGIRIVPPMSWYAGRVADVDMPAGLVEIAGFALTNTLAGLSHASLAYFLWLARALVFPLRIPAQAAQLVPPPPLPTARPGRGLLAAAALSGCAAIALEVLWTRALALPFKGFTWTFSAVLVFWLLGSALGSAAAAIPALPRSSYYGLAGTAFALAAWLFGRSPVRGILEGIALAGIVHAAAAAARARRGARPALGLLFAFAGAASLASIPILGALPARAAAAGGADLAGLLGALGASALAVLTLPAAIFGALLPAALLAAGPAAPGASTGRLWALNGLGAAAGAILPALVLVPLLGLQGSIVFVSLALAAGGGILLLRDLVPLGAPAAAAAVAALSLAHALSGPPFWRRLPLFEDGTPPAFRRTRSVNRVVAVREGAEGMAAVVENPDYAYRSLYTDGFSASDTRPAGHYMRMAGHLPALLAAGRRRAFVLGLGTGITTDALSKHPFELIEVAEISSGVADCLPAFAPWNGKLHERIGHAPFRLVLDDARHRLLLEPPGSYDVITADPLPPYFSGSVHVYTRNYFRLARSRLAPGGVLAHWAPAHLLPPEDFRALVRTFADVFPGGSLWFFRDSCLLVGTAEGAPPDLARAARRAREPAVLAALASIDLARPADVLGGRLLDGEALRRFGADGTRTSLVTDDRPLLEFSVLKRRPPPEGSFSANLRALAKAAQAPRALPPGLPADDAEALAKVLAARPSLLEALALANSSRGDRDGEVSPAAARLIGERFAEAGRLDPGSSDAADRAAEARALLRLVEGRDLLEARKGEAVEALEEAVSRRPLWPGALAVLAKARLRAGQPSEAERLLRRAVQVSLDPNHPLPEVRDLLREAAEERPDGAPDGTAPTDGAKPRDPVGPALDRLLDPAKAQGREERKAAYQAYLESGAYDRCVFRGLSEPDGLTRRAVGELLAERGRGEDRERIISVLREAAGRREAPTLSAEAGRVLALLGDDAGTPALLRGLLSDDPLVRQSACEALGALKAPAGFELLVSRMRDPDWSVRVHAIEAVASFRRKDSIPALIDLTDDPDREIRAAALEALRGLTGIPMSPEETIDGARELKRQWQRWWEKDGNGFEVPAARAAPPPARSLR